MPLNIPRESDLASPAGWLRATKARAPVDGASVIWLPGATARLARRNLAPDRPPLTIVGAPTISAGHLGLKSNSHFLETSALETAEYTIISVARNTDTLASSATRPMLISTLATGANASDFGSSLWVDSSTSGLRGSTGLAVAGNSWLAQIVPTQTLAAFAFVYARCTSTLLTVGNKTAGLVATDNSPSGARLASPRTWRIGSSYQVFAGTHDQAGVLIFPFALTDAQIEAVYEWIKAILAERRDRDGNAIAIAI